MSKTWFNIKAQADNPDHAEVYIFDEIGGWGVMASALIAAWPKSAKSVCLKINSPGGEVLEGLAIYNFLQEQKKTQEVVCRVEGLAASMASVVAIGGSVVEMSENSLLMIHNPWGCTAGDSDELRKTAEILDKMGEQLCGIYCARTGKSAEEVKKMMDEETWMTAKEAVDMKFADRIVNSLNAKLSALIEPFRAKLNEGRLVAAMAKVEPPHPKANAEDVVAMLQKAMASEWIAYYQYWIGAKVARGLHRAAIADELAAHAEEEYGHAEKLAARIVELGGLPKPGPGEWDAMSPCKYAAPEDQESTAVVRQNHEAEKCAIAFYQTILAATAGTDEATYSIVLKILEDENEHESDLRKFLEDAEMWAKAQADKAAAKASAKDPKDAEIAALKAQVDHEIEARESMVAAEKAKSAELAAKLAKAFPEPVKMSAKGVPAKPSAVSNHL